MYKVIFVLIGFVIATIVNYAIFSYMHYGVSMFGIWRLCGIGISFLFFFQFIRTNNLINRASNYLLKHNIQNKGNYFFAFIFSIAHIVVVLELTELYNSSLLNNSNIQTQALITNCEESYCVCEYYVNGESIKQKFNNFNYGFEEGDRVEIVYYTNNANIYRIKDANI